ncbi:MAG: bifunctional shikimate kinase/3-dehydroquinate synthase [Desulfarculaceae bacterium]|jgi:3-dehydroquinate synthase
MNGNIYITGFMGAGKTTLGSKLAALVRRPFVDMDQVLAKRLGMSIPQAFATLGEDSFRRTETGELKRLGRRQGLVVATGGGAPRLPQNRRIMSDSGCIVHLAASLEACRRHLADSDSALRPLWRDEQALARLYHSRQQAYGDCQVKLAVDGKGPDQLVEQLAALLISQQSSRVRLDDYSHPLISTWEAPQALAEFSKGRRLVILCDRKVARLHLHRYEQALADGLLITLPPGERFKSLRSAERVYRAMLEAHIERGDLLVALGGGVITDLGAFVASTFKRGMDFIPVATTLLGCVDAAIGGKAAMNLGPEKNQVGCFSKPSAVVLDLRALGTLPRRLLAEGLAEAYKTGLVADPELAAHMQKTMPLLLRGDLLSLAPLVWSSAQAKASVVKDDFEEHGRRRILNLGHTFAHALEGTNGYGIGHGRAVAVGMQVAAQISQQRGLLDRLTADRIRTCLEPLAPRKLAWPSADKAWALMQNDKKNQNRRVSYVLLQAPGEPLIVDDVTLPELAQTLERVKEA